MGVLKCIVLAGFGCLLVVAAEYTLAHQSLPLQKKSFMYLNL